MQLAAPLMQVTEMSLQLPVLVFRTSTIPASQFVNMLTHSPAQHYVRAHRVSVGRAFSDGRVIGSPAPCCCTSPPAAHPLLAKYLPQSPDSSCPRAARALWNHYRRSGADKPCRAKHQK